ncbi:class I SAM-dependent methyltransferase, partial [Rhizobium bangladeshense]|uniref:class I SAM-dependent methyltransferase n=1 Tax=Rhizobium bangladeshense TaxID=1138189 RepID=UPI001C91D3A1
MALDLADFYDAELARYNWQLRDAANVGTADRVLDIGCGAGQTTREAARAATRGQAVGVDSSAEMLEIARRRSAAEGLRNAAFEQGDAEVHAFPAASFDLCISRFGVMFFADPAAAFANIGR